MNTQIKGHFILSMLAMVRVKRGGTRGCFLSKSILGIFGRKKCNRGEVFLC